MINTEKLTIELIKQGDKQMRRDDGTEWTADSQRALEADGWRPGNPERLLPDQSEMLTLFFER